MSGEGASTGAARRLELTDDRVRLALEIGGGRPARLVGLSVAGGRSALREHPLVEVFTAAERHSRMTLGYTASAVGERLRVVDAELTGREAAITQRDAVTGLAITTRLTLGADGFAIEHDVLNTGAVDVVLFALPTLTVRTAAAPEALTLVSGRSEWLGEGRWADAPVSRLLPELGFATVAQPDRTGYGQSSSGGWSTGSVLPTGALVGDEEPGVAWQIESSAGWQWSLSRGDGGVVLSAGGPTEREHQAELRLAPGERFTTVPAACVVGVGRDELFAALTRHRRALRRAHGVDRALPVVYNDYMNTLMGQPSTEALLPLIAAAAEAGAEIFCIDAGWFTDSRDYWGEIGEWADAPTRFTGGLRAVIDAIRAAGMEPGIWLEPEAVGLDSPMIERLPVEAFFARFGQPVVEQRRRHLDLRHPAARAHLDAVVDRLVADHGIRYLKLDYNIEPGSGTDADGLAPGQGLLGHTRALRAWLVDLQRRHPGLLLENCASGAMRSDYHLLAVTHIQSTSDQQDALRYAAIAASAPATVLPEQSGNWAYPAVGMSTGELNVTLVSGMSGRLYLAGFLDQLSPEARALTGEAVAFAKQRRAVLADALPFWPRGLPGWDDDVLVLGQRFGDRVGEELWFVWSRGAADELLVPGAAEVTQVFPSTTAWPITRVRAEADAGASGDAGAGPGTRATHRIGVPAGPDAAVFRVRRAAS
jgi:alpha-galactosidase